MSSQLQDLPTELLLEILEYVYDSNNSDPSIARKTLISIGNVSRRFRQLCKPLIFRRLQLRFPAGDHLVSSFRFPTTRRLRDASIMQARGMLKIPPRKGERGPLFWLLMCPLYFLYVLYKLTLENTTDKIVAGMRRLKEWTMIKARPGLLANPAARGVDGYPFYSGKTPTTDRVRRGLRDKTIPMEVFTLVKTLVVTLRYLYNDLEEDWAKSLAATYGDFSSFVARQLHLLLDAMPNLQTVEVILQPHDISSVRAIEAFMGTIYSRKPDISIYVFLREQEAMGLACLPHLSNLRGLQVDCSRVYGQTYNPMDLKIAGVINRSPTISYLSILGSDISCDGILREVKPEIRSNLRTLDVSGCKPPQAWIGDLPKLQEINTSGMGAYLAGLRGMWEQMSRKETVRPKTVTAFLLDGCFLDLLSGYGPNLTSLSLYIHEPYVPADESIDNLSQRFWKDVVPYLSHQLRHLSLIPAMHSHELCLHWDNLLLFSASNLDRDKYDFPRLSSAKFYGMYEEGDALTSFAKRCPRLARFKLRLFHSCDGCGDVVIRADPLEMDGVTELRVYLWNIDRQRMYPSLVDAFGKKRVVGGKWSGYDSVEVSTIPRDNGGVRY